ncbi:hypothetical protein PTTG_27516 [Puccinia triticina 1-1 BBBD Race 1]|uniref:Uncharacterized protein n=2 Tax=Puccinia triticina TaxID=208348 RepID=A0A180GKA2_PUCT1|nr:uncharacterized protein PtA15_14A269 [Puccinia triticina]OAV92879.1 hypothetical protein PTTG_27516 [Puccinia triticina 1-1 BBBD Race 1]WAQ91386.1 hypothetical protein PtA15_14A269 [Puccinia triticina]WAR62185.1 hypothetical protein PtB15_14B279 [Puccinia triticina]
MEDTPQSEAAQALEILRRFKLACKDPAFRRALRRASQKDLYLMVQSKLLSLREIFEPDNVLQVTVDHPHLWTLCSQYAGVPQKNLGTPAAPCPGAQEHLPPRPLAPAPCKRRAATGFSHLAHAMANLT